MQRREGQERRGEEQHRSGNEREVSLFPKLRFEVPCGTYGVVVFFFSKMTHREITVTKLVFFAAGGRGGRKALAVTPGISFPFLPTVRQKIMTHGAKITQTFLPRINN